MLRALHQASAQPRVAQPRLTELVTRPGLGVEPVANRQRRHSGCGHREACAPRRLQGVHIHRLARFRRRVRAVPATAPAGLTHPNPVRRAHARPRLFGLVDERLQQPGAIAVQTLAVVADRPGGPAQHVAGRPGCGTQRRGAPAAGTVPTPGAGGRDGPYRPTRPRRRGPPQPPRTRRGQPDPAQPTMRRTHQIPWSCSSSVDTYPLGEEEESTMPKSRPPYPAAFRQQMVELVRSGRTPGELAREFEPSAEAIRNWVAQADRDAGKRSDGLRTEEHEEIRRLRRENRQLREEREILAKATAWFARETGPGRSTGS